MDPARKQPSTRTPRQQDPDRAEPPDQERDENLDRTLEDTFPASDPPSTIPDPADGADQPHRRDDDRET